MVIPRLSISEMNNKNNHGDNNNERFKLFSADARNKGLNNQNTKRDRYNDDISPMHWFPNFDNLKSRQGTDSINLPLST